MSHASTLAGHDTAASRASIQPLCDSMLAHLLPLLPASSREAAAEAEAAGVAAAGAIDRQGEKTFTAIAALVTSVGPAYFTSRRDRVNNVLLRCATALSSTTTSEEVKLAACQVVSTMLQTQLPRLPSTTVTPDTPLPGADGSGPATTVPHLAAEASRAFVGHLVSTLCDLASGSTSRALRIAAVDAVAAVCGAVTSPDVVGMFLPGISSVMFKVCREPTHTNSRVTAAALVAWATVLALAVGDIPNADVLAVAPSALERLLAYGAGVATSAGPPAPTSEAEAKGVDGDGPQRVLRLTRTYQWLQESGSRVSLLLSALLPELQKHPHHAVRQALASFCGDLVRRCGSALSDAMPLLLETLVALRDDVLPAVRDTARGHCDTAIRSLPPTVWQSSLRALEARFNSATVALPRVARGGDEAALRAHVNRMTGFVALVGPRLGPLLEPVLPRLIQALVQTVVFDVLHPSALRASHDELRAGAGGDGSTSVAALGATRSAVDPLRLQATAYYRHPLRLLTEPETLSCLAHLFDLLVANADPSTLLQTALQPLLETTWKTGNRVELLFITAAVVRALARSLPSSSEDAVSWEHPTTRVASTMLNELLAAPAWAWSTTLVHARQALPTRHSPAPTLEGVQRDAMTVSLVLEGVGDVAEVLRGRFRPHLVRALFPVLAKMGDAHPVVRQAALATLQRMALHTGSGSVDKLLSENMDYLVDAVVGRLQYIGGDAEMGRTVAVVECIASHALEASVPLIKDTVAAILRSVDTYRDSSHLKPLLRVMRSIVDVARLNPEAPSVPPPGDTHAGPGAGASQLAIPESKEPPETRMAAGGGGDVSATGLSALLSSTLVDMEAAWVSRAGEASDLTEAADDGASAEEYFRARLQEKRDREAAAGPLDSTLEDLEDTAAAMEGDPARDADPDAASASTPWEFRRKAVLSTLQEVVESLLRRAQHFLASPSPDMAILGLGIVEQGALALHSRPKRLHPLLHDLWPSVQPRVHHSHPAVRARAHKLLVTLVVDAGCAQFLQRRFEKGVWPELMLELRRGDGALGSGAEATASLRQRLSVTQADGSGAAQSATALVRRAALSLQGQLHASALDALAALVSPLDIKGELALEACLAAAHFLAPSTHVTVRRAAQRLLAAVERLDAPCVWWFKHRRREVSI